jgi:hypothetical protein
MKTTKLISKLTTGCRIKIKHCDGFRSEKATVLDKYSTGRYSTTEGYLMDENLSIPGIDKIIATCEVIPFKRYKFRYKR